MIHRHSPRRWTLGADKGFETAGFVADLHRAAAADETARRLQSMPGIGSITDSVLAATVPEASAFRSARDLWPGWA